MRTSQAGLILVLIVVSALPAMALLPDHPSELAPLTADAQFPRYSDRELALAGFPDHLHGWWWSDWEVMQTAEGEVYGPRSICSRNKELNLDAAPGLVAEPGHLQYRHLDMEYNPGYATCDMALFLEIMDWATRLFPDVLDLPLDGTLHVLSPDNVESYSQLTHNGVWRLYHLDGDACIVEPVPTLQARTLEGHAAFMLIADWILTQNCGDALPRWLHQGLVEYLGEDGVHLLSYMSEFRVNGSVLFSPPLTNALLSKPVDPKNENDREHFRRACYSAYLMVWQLVESEGGLDPLRDLLNAVANGTPIDEASRLAYGLSMDDLAEMLDPVQIGEPLGKNPERHRPHLPPE